ncbi:histidine kinase dimerization/phosphoacceptor domain -containing protein [uncultured Aquimarina sp.]|uniref:histidine kinase dimerization/phosphoacceptor domain -containing protein n=1 Tax=uncultured Aquimarina sp. TaxID=575652 RepID=UPI002631F910|nr:histidine kinase dimerization/phosphoacceptor domain -containing protein [uncultured Aquimarina sp.]
MNRKPFFKKLTIILSIVLFYQNSCYSQEGKTVREQIDSLQTLLKLKPTDSLSIFIDLTDSYNNLQNDSANIYMDKSLSILNTAVSDNRKVYEVLTQKHSFFVQKYAMDSIKKINLKRLNIANEIEDDELVFDCYSDIAAYQVVMRRFDSATYFFDNAKLILPKINDKESIASYYTNLGMFNAEKGDFDSAIKNYIIALEIQEDLNDIYALASIYNSIGVLSWHTNEMEKVIYYVEKSLQYSREIGNEGLICTNLYNLGSCYLELKNTKKSSELLNEALVYANKLELEYIKADIYNNLGTVSVLEKKDYATAIVYNKTALEIYKKTGDEKRYIATLRGLAKNYLNKGDYEKSKIIIDSALVLSNQKKIIEEKPDLYKLLSRIDSIRGDYLSSLINYKESIRVLDSLEKVKSRDEIKELQVKFETSQKEKEITTLNSENKIKELQIVRQRYQNYILWAILGMSAIAIGSIFFQYRIKKRNNLLLSNKNEEIEDKNQTLIDKSTELEKALGEKEVLLKEVHHRVKNNLQLVTSILNLQADRLNDKKIEAFVERSQNRITSMALVHQILYSNDKIEHIDFHKYLLKLVKAGYDSFDFNDQKIKYTIDAEEFYFHIDTAIPVGIIVNELVHNAFKYAFDGKKTGILGIKVYKEVEKIAILIEDDGIGISEKDPNKESSSYGLKLVELLVRQINGEMIVSKNNGTSIKILFEYLKP